MAIPISELQSVNPSALIELFQLQLISGIHYASGSPPVTDGIYYFHSGTSLKTNNAIIWKTKTYQRYPVECTGFEYNNSGALPRPQMQISNVLNLFTALIATVNTYNIGNDLVGAKFIRIRTLAEFLDAGNFENDKNIFGTPDPNQELPQEIYFLNKKLFENRSVVSYEMVSALDLVNVKLPKRIVTRKDFPGVGGFV
tara:strand:- start:1209 stop:1802 length:594 start_codon:yes stop_codon:yes gene_type:complete